ncbi:unnamed protein product [Adineta steineri]|uniref:RBR-type E3 ubiquitin transferase n=1 Tax=Adineta steineri TaxID=433720 RepID=A0A815LWW4_9BILA|nr:unnamed protein product [Adineta steineri]CAF4038126.1 unnamed protein product [Adineta steineri]
MLNITFQTFAGKSIPTMIKHDFDLNEFKKAAATAFEPIDGYRFVIDGTQLDLEHEDKFNEQKSKITDDKTIFVLARLRGGGFLDISTFIDIIYIDLPNELKKIKRTKYQCAICCLDNQCIKLCCSLICEECFTCYFKSKNLQIKCLICPAVIAPKDIFVSRDFITSLRSYEELQTLLKHIDCQVCTCGALVINETMYPKQRCLKCSRDFCFFCNKNWNNETMEGSTKYTCSSGNCYYETMVSFNLVTFAYSSDFPVPNRRCCPECSTAGGYDEKCKYHTCNTCDHRFCFFCLLTEPECIKKYGGGYSKKCIEPVKQGYTIFPRLNKT